MQTCHEINLLIEGTRVRAWAEVADLETARPDRLVTLRRKR
jgi:hypothetical protein